MIPDVTNKTYKSSLAWTRNLCLRKRWSVDVVHSSHVTARYVQRRVTQRRACSSESGRVASLSLPATPAVNEELLIDGAAGNPRLRAEESPDSAAAVCRVRFDR